MIADMRYVSGKQLTFRGMAGNELADAAFIVRACNEYDDLLAIAQALVENIVACPDCKGNGRAYNDPDSACRDCGGSGSIIGSESEIIQAALTARAAIAEAEGQGE